MINPAVNKNIDTPNSRAAMAQDQNIVKLINRATNAIKSRGGNLESPVSKAIVNRAIMLYKQGQGKKVVTADGSMVRKQYHEGGVAGHVHDENNPDPDAAETKTAEELAAEAAEAAEKERLAGMAKQALEGQRKLIVDINTDPTKAVEKATVATINKNAVGATVDESVGKIATPIDLAGTKGEYVQPVETIEPVLTGERKAKALDDIKQSIAEITVQNKPYDEKYDLVPPFGEITGADTVQALRFTNGLPVDQAVTDKMNALLEGARGTVTTPGYYKEGGPKGIATATDVEKPDDITASKVTTKTATGDIRSSLTGGERDYVTVPLENVKFLLLQKKNKLKLMKFLLDLIHK